MSSWDEYASHARRGYFVPTDFDGSSWPVPNAGAPWRDSDIRELKDMVLMGHGVKSIAKSMGRSAGAIEAAMERLELRIPSKHYKLQTVKAFEPNAERKHVNFNHLITMLQKGYTTVHVEFRAGEQKYTYKAPTTMNLVVGDKVVVEARKELKIATVAVVDEEPKIDIKAPYALGWVAQKIDLTAYNDQVRREDEAVALLQKGERAKAQKEAMEALLESVPDRKELFALLGLTTEGQAGA